MRSWMTIVFLLELACGVLGSSTSLGQVSKTASEAERSRWAKWSDPYLHVGDQIEFARPIDFSNGMRLRFERIDTSEASSPVEIMVDDQRWFQWGCSQCPGGPWQVELLDGSCITGECQSIDENGIGWESAIWGKLQIPRELVRGVYRGSLVPGSFRAHVSRLGPTTADKSREGELNDASQAWLILSDGSVSVGRWSGPGTVPKNGKERFSWLGSSGPMSVAWEKVVGIEYRRTVGVKPVEGLRMVWDQGDCLHVMKWGVRDDGAIEMELGVPYSVRTSLGSQGLARRLVGVSRLALPSPDVREFRREKPAAYRHMPLQRGQFPMRGGDEVLDKGVVIDGLGYEDAISIPSPGQAAFTHDGRRGWFCSELVGRSRHSPQTRLDGEVYGEALTAKVMVSRGGGLEVAWSERIVLDGVARRIVRLPVEGVRLIVLIHERLNEYDLPHDLDWVNPRIVLAKE